MDISECVSSEQLRAVWPVIAQLREGLEPTAFEQRVIAAREEGYRLFAALQAGKVVGAIGFRLLHDLASGRSLYVDDLVVDEDERGQHVGRRLMAFVDQTASDEACAAIRLTSATHREGAHAFYHRIGFDRPGFVFKKTVRKPGQ